MTAASRAVPPPVPPGRLPDYVRAHSAGSILRSTLRIYRRHFGLLLLAALIPLVPGVLIELARGSAPRLFWVNLLDMVLSFLGVVPITVLISDICVSNRPTLARAYRRAFGRLSGTVFLAFLLSSLAVIGGFLMLVVPGLVFAQWFLLAGPVLVLERPTAVQALSRSRQLGAGSHWRNAGIYFISSIVMLTSYAALGALAGALRWSGWLDVDAKLWGTMVSLLGVVVAPPLSIVIVLLYYDMRVRKEAYDSSQLAEDLRR